MLPQRFIKYLSPSERLSEILFGLIMVLTITSTINIALTEGEASITIMVFAALATNFAWGIVDGLMYLITTVFERARHAKLFQQANRADKRQEVLAIIQEEIDSTVLRELSKEQKENLVLDLIEKTSGASFKPAHLSRDDLMGAFSSFFLVFVSALPVTLPFLFLPSLNTALRISNVIAFLMLFTVGYKMAAHIGTKRIQTGVVMAIIGISIVAITVSLGG